MAAAIPLIASFASVSAGVAAGLTTFTGFALAAGGVLTGIGALTGKKDLMKVGAVLSLGGAAAGAFGAAAAGGGAAAGEATGQAAQEAFRASELAGTNALGDAVATTGPVGATGADSLFQAAANRTAANLPTLANAPNPSGFVNPLAAPDTSSIGAALTQPAQPVTTLSPALRDAGMTMNSSDLQGYLARGLDRAKSAASGFGQFLKDNKELAQIGGNALSSMYGPNAEMLDWQKSLYERRRANLNNPVVLGRTG